MKLLSCVSQVSRGARLHASRRRSGGGQRISSSCPRSVSRVRGFLRSCFLSMGLLCSRCCLLRHLSPCPISFPQFVTRRGGILFWLRSARACASPMRVCGAISFMWVRATIGCCVISARATLAPASASLRRAGPLFCGRHMGNFFRGTLVLLVQRRWWQPPTIGLLYTLMSPTSCGRARRAMRPRVRRRRALGSSLLRQCQRSPRRRSDRLWDVNCRRCVCSRRELLGRARRGVHASRSCPSLCLLFVICGEGGVYFLAPPGSPLICFVCLLSASRCLWGLEMFFGTV